MRSRTQEERILTGGHLGRVFGHSEQISIPKRGREWATASCGDFAQGVFKPFLDVTPQDVRETLEVNVTTAFTFARESILDFKKNDIADGKRGTIIFTGATAALRGNVMTSVFAAGKHGQRALSQSLAKEFGKDNIHVAHTIIDGQILTDRTRSYNDGASNWATNADVRLSPESIASAYLYLVNQDRSAWT
ncbi:hypothetical protein PTI98_013320 [Pleurotus ostreatus]|nr:hypothetical protein PTI98_013320 [Pleurotus ostreatus]